MQSNFELSCKAAREAIVVPPFPLSEIRSGANSTSLPQKRRFGLAAAVLIGASIAAAATAAEVFSSHVSFSTGAMQLSFDSAGDNKSNPTAADFSEVGRKLNFPLIAPAGLPSGTIAKHFTRLDADAILVFYELPGRWRRSNHVLTVLLANMNVSAATVGAHRSKGSILLPGAAQRERFIVGREQVVLMSNTLTSSEIQTIKRATKGKAN